MFVGNVVNIEDSKVFKVNICYCCWILINEGNFIGGVFCIGFDIVGIFQELCCKMICQIIIFFYCWDGKNFDIFDYKFYVVYGQGFGVIGGGVCLFSYFVKFFQFMYELMWNVINFSDKNMWFILGFVFVYSMNFGGFVVYGDYVFGWEGDIFQCVMDKGCNFNCVCFVVGFIYQFFEVYNVCNIKQQVFEFVDGCKFLFLFFL